MTFYRTFTSHSNDWITSDTLEGVAVQVKRKRSEINQLAIAYERAQDALDTIMKKQKEASTQFAELKKKLVELAEDIEDGSDKE